MSGDELPLAFANGSISFVFPVERFAFNRFFVEGRRKTPAFCRRDFMALIFTGILCIGDIDTRCHDVDEMPGLMAQLAASFYARRPVYD
jgi:hypothetical protein